jgi:hypothetical protein
MTVWIVQRESCDYDDYDQEVVGVYASEQSAKDGARKRTEALVKPAGTTIFQDVTWVDDRGRYCYGVRLPDGKNSEPWDRFSVSAHEVQS